MLIFEGKAYEPELGETVLQCLTRHGVRVPSFCQSGACQTCLLKATGGTPPAKAQAGLKDSWKQQGYVLTCVCDASVDLELARSDAAKAYETRITRVEQLNDRVVRLFVAKPSDFEFLAGQFVQIERPSDGVARPYSIASLPSAPELEFHVALQPGGALSPWLAQAAGEPVSIRGAFGDCFYVPGEPDRALLLAGTGTGLAPLWGVVCAAVEAKHTGPMELFHGALTEEGLYLWNALTQLAARVPNFAVRSVVLDRPATAYTEGSSLGAVQHLGGELDRVVLQRFQKPTEVRSYLCGNPDLVRNLKKRLYLAGASLSRIHSDPFFAPAGSS